MNFLQFRQQFYELGCVQVHQIYVWNDSFDKNNLTRWVNNGLLLKLRNGYYCFPEYLNEPNFALVISNWMYTPSYISLHTALAFYGMIPEAIVQTTAVCGPKKASFDNAFGTFTYQHIAALFMFGYELKPFDKNRAIRLATPEKALLDLLYLYPFYKTSRDMEELRLDNDFMHNDFDKERFLAYTATFNSNRLKQRAQTLLKTYDL
jgi:predicted transcriptional regulator of viral defense system